MPNHVKKRQSWETPHVRKIEAGSAEGSGAGKCDNGIGNCGDKAPRS